MLMRKNVNNDVNRIRLYLWTGENDAKTLRVDANFFEEGEKKLLFQTNTDTCGQGLSHLC